MNQANGLSGMFYQLTARPGLSVVLGLALVIAAGSGLSRLVKDTSLDAFVPPDHPALQASHLTTELFGLSDPIAVAVFSKTDETVFSARLLSVVDDITQALGALPNVRPDRVASITTEASIAGANAAIDVSDYYNPEQDIDAPEPSVAARWRNMPPHIDTLVSQDERGAVIMAELIDAAQAPATYAAVQALVGRYQDPDVEILVAGPAAVSGYLSAYIDQDARLLQPIVFVIVLAFLYLAFMRAAALLGPILVLLGSAGGALGIMAWQGVPYFAITNALPVILVAISVADAIHILSAYFERRAQFPEQQTRAVVVGAMVAMARPITLTTVTTIAGFFGIAVLSIMPPIAYFAWYAMLGVFLAWVFSLFVLPGVLMLIQPKPSPLFVAWRHNRSDRTGALLGSISHNAARFPVATICGFVLVLTTATFGAMQLRVDRSQVDNFSAKEPIRIADDRINAAFAGTAFLDIVVSTDDGDLLQNGRLHKVAELQDFLDDLPHVNKTVSIVDYLSLLHAAINEVTPDAKRLLPAEDDALAQYLMVYEASGDPTDFEEEITTDYTHALVRNVLDSHYFSDAQPVVEAVQTYLRDEFNEPGLEAFLAGDVNTAYHWMSDLKASHFSGVGLSLLLILAVCSWVFRSIRIGIIAVLPVSFTVVCIYGVMGLTGIHLEPATSMFAAISVGVGVDFSTHIVDRLQTEQRATNDSLETVILRVVPSTARACFFNAAALATGFAVLLVSDLPTLQRFGGLVAIASLASFVAALILIPACLALLERTNQKARNGLSASTANVFLLVLAGTLLASEDAMGMTGLEVAEKVAARSEPTAAIKTIDMILTNKRGQVRNRQAKVFRLNGADVRQTRISYLAPKPVRELTFLSRDFLDGKRTDERWLYLPAARKVRRIPASGRGDYFLGTDFTYEDLQSDLKFEIADYQFNAAGESTFEDKPVHRVQGTPINAALVKQLGHARFTALIEARSWFPRQIEFFDKNDKRIKTIVVDELIELDGIWVAKRISALHHKTGHQTVFEYSNIEHQSSLPESLFTASQLTLGLTESH